MPYTLAPFQKAISLLFFIHLFAGISVRAQDDSLLAPKYTDTTYYYYRYDTVARLIETETISPGTVPNAPVKIPQGIMQPLAIHEHIPTSFEPDRAKNVGEIPIQSGVSVTGAMNYMVPIQIAPGRATLPVSVSLAYSSQGNSGFMGFGWSLGGLSLIQELSTNIYYNTKTEPLKLSKAGQFVLDGMKLVKLSENSTQITYQSEQGNIKVTAYLSGSNIKYFNVFYPNGSSAIFGYESNTVQQLYYPLTRIVDIHENRVQYTYTLRNGQYYISKIEYGGTASLAHFASIDFTYATRTDVNTVYSAGQTLTKDWLLTSIVCKSSGSALRTYAFTYQYANNTALLQKIDCSAGGGSLNPLQFYYGNGSTTAQLVKTTTQLTSWFPNTSVANLKVSKGKFDYGTDNDGVISYPNLNPYYEQFIPGDLFNHSKKEYINLFATDQKLLVYQGLQDAMASPSVEILTGAGFVNMLSADIDGKPGEEVIKINNLKNGTQDRVEFRIYKANLYAGLALTNTYTFDLGELLTWFNTRSVHPKYFYSGDFNGDGKMEILAVSSHNPLGNTGYVSKTYIFNVESGIKRHESTGLNFKIDYAVLSGVNDDILFPVDIDADGKTDIMHIHDNGTDVYTFDISGTTYTRRLIASNTNLKKADVKYRQLAIGDMNADGLPDILISPRESYYYDTYITLPVYAPRYCSNGHEGTYSNGSCSTCGIYMPESSYCYECNSYLNDEYTCPNHGTTVTVTHSEYVDNGNTWSAFYCKGNGVLDKKTITFKKLEQYEKIILQDINRDNTTDVVSNRNGSINAYLVNNGIINTGSAASAYVSGGNYVIPSHVGGENFHSQLLSLNNGLVDKLAFSRNDGAQRLVTGMISSLGVVSKTDYRLINEGISQYGNSSDWYTQGSGALFPYLNYQGPVTVVYKGEQWLKSTQLAHTTHRYNNALVHLQGLGFTGFGTVHTTNEMKGQTLTQTYNPLQYGILTKEESPAAVINYTYNFSVAANRIARIWVTQKTANDVLKNTTLTSTYTYDSYGNLTAEVNDYGGGLKSTVTNTITNSTGSPYVLGVVSVKTAVKERGGASVTVKDTYTFTPQYRPLTKISTYNNNTIGQEGWTHDAFGNVTEEKTKAYSATAWLTTQYQYDAVGRFMTKKINPLSQSTDYVFAAATGTLTSEKDFKNNTITYEYDGWQRLKKVNNPDGSNKTVILEWQPAGSNRLYNTKEESNIAPTAKTMYDGLGRVVRSSIVGFDGAEVLIDQAYDVHGRPSSKSLPYKSGSAASFTNYSYDSYDRPTQVSAPSGSQSSYSYSGTTITETTNGVAETKNFDATGALLSVNNSAGTITYGLRPDGQPSSISAPGGANTGFGYDVYGRQTTITDPSAGTVTYTYDASGNLNKTTNAKGESITSVFDSYGRFTSKITPELTSTYTYNTDGLLSGITNSNSTSKTLTYDNLGRVTQTKEHTGTEYYQVNYTYQNGRLASAVHAPVSYTVNYVYNSYGYLSKLTNSSGVAIKTFNKINANGQVEELLLGNGLLQTNTYNSYGLLTGIKTANGSTNIQNMSYTMDNAKGLMLNRKDVTRNLTENFGYDALQRLTSYGLSTAQKTITYNNATGNILTKSDAGAYKYTITGKPYATSSITSNGSPLPTTTQQVSYTSFSRPKQITEGAYVADLVYEDNAQRAMMVMKNNGSTMYTRYYFANGQYEKTIQGSTVKTILYLDGSPYNATVALETNAGVSRLLYISRDHIGSITHITNASKVLQAEYSYDAWGRMRNPVTLAVYAPGTEPGLLLNRGYTGHEHLKEFGLINMNARLYDALVGRMISPDNYVQDPLDPRNYNRYAYAMNNPLSYIDPDGNIVWFVPVIIGAIVGAYAGASIQSHNWIPKYWKKDWWQGAVVGGIVGAATGGIVAWASGAAGTVSGSIAGGWKMVSSGLISGNISMASKWAQGGDLDDIWKSGAIGFASGAIGGWAQLNFADKMPTSFLSNSGILPEGALRNGLGQIVSGSLYGTADRLITSYGNGVKGLNLLLHGIIGNFEGAIGGVISSSNWYSWMRPPLVKTFISSTIASVPGWGIRAGKAALMLYGAAAVFDLYGSGASLTQKLLGGFGILGGESIFGLLNTADWLKKINYPDPFPIKWF